MMAFIKELWMDESGQDYVEYFLLAGAAAAIFAALGTTFKEEIQATIQFVINQLREARK